MRIWMHICVDHPPGPSVVSEVPLLICWWGARLDARFNIWIHVSNHRTSTLSQIYTTRVADGARSLPMDLVLGCAEFHLIS
jgi:hypothetical protein